MQSLDIYGAEKHVLKLLEYIQGVASARPKMYAKSKDRLRELASNCYQIVQLISSMLEEEALGQDVEEFSQCADSNVSELIVSMQDQLNNLQKFIGVTAESHVQTSVESAIKIPKDVRREAMRNYGAVLHNLAETNIEYGVVSDLAKVLWRWYDTRFFQNSKSSTNFRYNIRRLPDWIYSIVLTYSKYVESGNQLEFLQLFDSWCEQIQYSDSAKFAIPYEVYLVDKSHRAEDLTLTAVVMWDILIDYGMKALCISDPYNLYVSENSLYERCVELNPCILDRYSNYKDNPDVLHVCKIVLERGESQ